MKLRPLSLLLVMGMFATAAWSQFASRPPEDRRTSDPYSSRPDPYGYRQLPNEVPEGYRFLVTLEDRLETARLAPGKHFKAKVRERIMAPNGQFIDIGKKVKGHVSDVDDGFRARLLLSFDEIQTEHGWVPLSATVVELPSERSVKLPGPEGEIERRPVDKKRAIVSAGIGALVGASIGSAAAGGKGAAIGAAVGAGAGSGAGILTGREIRLDKGTQLVLRLDRGLILP